MVVSLKMIEVEEWVIQGRRLVVRTFLVAWTVLFIVTFLVARYFSLPLPIIESGQFAAFRIANVNELMIASSSTECTKQLQSCILNFETV